MKVHSEQKWIGLAHVKPVPGSDFFDGDPGAYCQVVGLASTALVFRVKVESVFAEIGLVVMEIEDLEPLEQRVMTGTISGELLTLADQLSASDPVLNDIFHVYSSDSEGAGDA